MTNFASYNETYGAIGGVMVLLLWFYVSGVALLIGAELNAEIEHASPYGKDVGEKVPGEKKRIGPAAERAYEERRATAESTFHPTRTTSIATSSREAEARRVRAERPADRTAALLPAALKIGREVERRRTRKTRRRSRLLSSVSSFSMVALAGLAVLVAVLVVDGFSRGLWLSPGIRPQLPANAPYRLRPCGSGRGLTVGAD